jgi:hypothetical protein
LDVHDQQPLRNNRNCCATPEVVKIFPFPFNFRLEPALLFNGNKRVVKLNDAVVAEFLFFATQKEKETFLRSSYHF